MTTSCAGFRRQPDITYAWNSALDHCPHRQVDDDSFVRVARVLERVAAMPRAAAMLGYIESPGGGPHRDPGNQWHVTLDEWPTDKYPPWAHGAGAAALVCLLGASVHGMFATT